MALPRAVTIRRDSVEYTNNVEAVQYTINELVRAALRDCGKLFCNRFRQAYYGAFKRKKGNVGRFTQYWVRSKQETPDLLVGIKPNAFYGGMQEFGSSKTARLGLLTNTAQENIDTMQEIQAQYLSAINQENPTVSDEEYEGGADG
ncbi:hypothetical protein [Cellulosilyticum lentocellum]|uniref:Phage protein, HK97 gp10 family n=1 Tax=Cellulosilyticum lentocellum (strain ATCC 49066 / DSM 5427 / NCIMB 11756 / RHM5) TaxID=642492 RepID=F2JPD2_CELLD|nr:hypothetical protein [Cellulosilyticum lentocellum]ADZ82480.1 hypothetical protein Clole_0747 [Cellulosilyticum lentocellum DSM 5427]